MNKKSKVITIGIVIISLLSLYFFINPSDVDFFPKCPFYAITGAYCPGCGSQRAIHDLAHFNIIEAISHNALMIFTLFFGGGLYLYSKKKFYKIVYHPKSPYIIFGIIGIYWILRNLDAFHYLAP
tara:strand:- start:2643 stop:3017 length:375 start_codon:yes stop_codon:yes gene_type:complete